MSDTSIDSNYGSTVLGLGKRVIAMTGNNDGDEVSASSAAERRIRPLPAEQASDD